MFPTYQKKNDVANQKLPRLYRVKVFLFADIGSVSLTGFFSHRSFSYPIFSPLSLSLSPYLFSLTLFIEPIENFLLRVLSRSLALTDGTAHFGRCGPYYCSGSVGPSTTESV